MNLEAHTIQCVSKRFSTAIRMRTCTLIENMTPLLTIVDTGKNSQFLSTPGSDCTKGLY